MPRGNWYSLPRFTEVWTAYEWHMSPDEFDAKPEITRAEMIEFCVERIAMQNYEVQKLNA